ncbi:hypothetical protein SLEP1_g23518 [Rubroshorea leprosula]|uniref:Uncharacterized protein n=1 Tax=Rubroshorea leprosula TaxID=152421 RepID=A0AAV5JLX7_9ROSI|nr:hypothetical protein SLEP1_g23518 [Rubroshorea leprosula]
MDWIGSDPYKILSHLASREEAEDEGHIMPTCKSAHQVSMKCFNWWGYVAVLPNVVQETRTGGFVRFFNAKIRTVWVSLLLSSHGHFELHGTI